MKLVMIIRKATVKDVDAISKNNICLAKETEARIIEEHIVQKGVKNVFLHEGNGFYLIAEENKRIIGQIFITIEWSDWRNQSIWWLHRIFVQKKYRKQKVFTSLFQKVKQLAEKNDVYALRLYMMDNNESALKIYSKLGFEHTHFLILQKK